MSKALIDLNDYLDDDCIKDVLHSQIREEVKKHFSNEENVQRLISNQAYKIVYKMVGDMFDESLDTLLKNKVHSLVSELSISNVFKKPDAWSRESNTAYQSLSQAMLDEKDNIKRIVKDNIEEAVLVNLKDRLQYYIIDAVKEVYVETSK